MVAKGAAAARLRTFAVVWLDALAYALVVTVAATLGALVVGIATGGGLVRSKAVLFLIGLGLMAYATIRLWPSSPSEFETDDRTAAPFERAGPSLPATQTETRFQALVRAVPPVRWLRPPPPERRLSPAAKLFVGSVTVLLASFLMETAFGVA